MAQTWNSRNLSLFPETSGALFRRMLIHACLRASIDEYRDCAVQASYDGPHAQTHDAHARILAHETAYQVLGFCRDEYPNGVIKREASLDAAHAHLAQD